MERKRNYLDRYPWYNHDTLLNKVNPSLLTTFSKKREMDTRTIRQRFIEQEIWKDARKNQKRHLRKRNR